MKRFKLHGRNANWVDGLRMSALNLRTLAEETSSPIPSDKRMFVSVANNVYHVDDTRREIIKGEVSVADKDTILANIKANTPDFLLTLEDKVVGYANLCNRNGVRTATDTTATADNGEPIKIEDIVDGETLALLIVPATATEPAHKKTEPKKWAVTKEVTIYLTTEVTAEDEQSAYDSTPDLLADIEDFLDGKYEDKATTIAYRCTAVSV